MVCQLATHFESVSLLLFTQEPAVVELREPTSGLLRGLLAPRPRRLPAVALLESLNVIFFYKFVFFEVTLAVFIADMYDEV